MQSPREPLPMMSLKELIMYNRAMHKFIMSQRLVGGPGVRVSYGPGGITLKGNARSIAKKAAAVETGPFPFDVSFTPLGVGTQTAAVRPGSVNSIIPSNYLTTYAQNTTGTQYFLIANVTVAAGAVTGCTLSFGTSPPTGMPVTLSTPPTSFQVLIGVVIDGVWYRTIGDGSLQCTATEAFKEIAASPVPGTSYYDLYYTWEVANV